MEHRRFGSRVWLAAALAVGLVAGCTSSGGDGAGPTGTIDLGGGDIELVSALLQRYDSCDAFLADLKAEALERVGPYGLGGGGWGWPMPAMRGFAEASADLMADDGAALERRTAGPTSTVGGDTFSGTNVQELGVDEPDIVKTDGSLLAVVDGQDLRLVDVTDPVSPALLSTTPLAGWGAQLLLEGDTLLVVQQVGQGVDAPSARAIGAPVTTVVDDEPSPGGRIAPGPWSMAGLTTVTQLDVADPSSPRVQRTWTVDGGYVSARLVDGVARVVLRSDPASRLPFVYPSGPSAEAAATEANRAVIEASTVDDWVASLTVADGAGGIITETRVAPCNQLFRPTTFSGFGLVSVLTADLGGDGLGSGDGVGVVSSGETLYASPTSVYVATNQWVEPDGDATAQDIMPRPSGSARTDVHQFAIEGSSPARYLASGSVDGYLLNQFSMSEHDGHLRLAVTEDQWSQDSVSSVVVLARRGEDLAEVGRVGELGRTERIYAVRFMGDRGYVVTFRQVDPLYTLDLSDPSNPRTLGELKIPGYSSYLHPVGEDLLIGVGQDATEEGMIQGSQISLFDVSNPADPQQVARLELGEGTSSEVEHDHHAFLVWGDLAVIPYVSYHWDGTSDGFDTGAIGVTVDAGARTLTERGRITHLDQGSPSQGQGQGQGRDDVWFDWDRGYQSQIRRSVAIGEVVLTVSERGLLTSDAATLEPLGWLSLG